MLTELHIRNFTIIHTLDLLFEKGMSSLTGETGAGKSVLVDAIELALGERSDIRWIRQGEQRCEIILCFDLKNHTKAKEWLKEYDLDVDNECIIRRTISQDGRSRCYINDQVVSLQRVKSLGALLLTVHGQHHNQLLFDKAYQRYQLDSYLNNILLLQAVNESYTTWHDLEKKAKWLEQKNSEAQTKLDFVNYQLGEIESLKLQVDEFENLENEQKKLSHADRILQDGHLALEKISGSENEIFKIQSVIKPLLVISTAFENINVLLEGAMIQMQEAHHELESHLESLSLNPNQLSFVEQRLSDIYTLARKYRVAPNDLYALQINLQKQRDELSVLDHQIELLHEEIHIAQKKYEDAALQLTEQRHTMAQKMSQAVQIFLPDLGMANAQFQIQLMATGPSAHGNEQVSFWMQTNKGQALQPLENIVSGGELSRLNLAIQAVFTHQQAAAVLIFDEIDTGIGGSVAALVGQLIYQLSKNVQVIAITHLPQVAARADHHYLVSKAVFEDKTCSKLQKLSQEERIEEMARMLGGLKITDRTRAHAKELLEC